MILSKNAEVKGLNVKAIEGKPMYGGDMLVKPLIKGEEMTFLEIHYAAGVGAPLHTYDPQHRKAVRDEKRLARLGADAYANFAEDRSLGGTGSINPYRR